MGTIPASENEFPQLLLTEGAAAATPAAGLVVAYAKADGLLYWKDDVGTEYAVGTGDTAGHIADTTDAHDASAVSFDPTGLAIIAGTEVQTALEELDAAVDGLGGASYTGLPVAIPPPHPLTTLTNGTNASAGFGWATPIYVPATMRVRAMRIEVTSNGSGSIEWGLFDGSSTPSTAVKVCGGSAAPGGTGYRAIAATSAPVVITPGGYILIWKMPDANASTIRTMVADSGVAPPWNQIWTAYTWDDTPDLTSASWVANTTVANVYLEGDLDASNTGWS